MFFEKEYPFTTSIILISIIYFCQSLVKQPH